MDNLAEKYQMSMNFKCWCFFVFNGNMNLYNFSQIEIKC